MKCSTKGAALRKEPHNPILLSKNEDALTRLLLYGDNTLTDNTNTFLLNSVIEYIISAKRLTIL